jgi:hypothetical protein
MFGHAAFCETAFCASPSAAVVPPVVVPTPTPARGGAAGGFPAPFARDINRELEEQRKRDIDVVVASMCLWHLRE